MPSIAHRLNLMVVIEGGTGTEILKLLPECGHRVVAVLTSLPEDERRIGLGTSLWGLAQKMDYTTLPARSVKDPAFAEYLKAHEVDVLLNVYSHYVIRKEVLDAARVGAFNLHPGPLPRYAGLNSTNWAIYRGETEHGITLHRMARGIDTGPIAYQTRLPIGPTETGLSLSTRCIREGLSLVRTLLTTLVADPDRVPRIPQDTSRRLYLGAEIPEGGCLSWSRRATDVFNFVRAADYSPFPSPWGYLRATLDGRAIGILKASLTGEQAGAAPGTVAAGDGAAVRVACLDDWLLIHRVRFQGCNVPAKEVVKPGQTLGDGQLGVPLE
jgi:methionyl-tRNA formyltransferase